MKQILIGVALNLLTPNLAFAHSFWLEPSKFDPEPEAIIALKIFVGENFKGEELVRHPTHLRTFTITTPKAEDSMLDIPGRHGSRPVGYLKIAERKPYIVSYTSNPNETVLTVEAFRSYVESEGLAKHVSLVNLAATEVKEQYTRNAKTLLVPPGFNGSLVDRATGMPLELICLCETLTMNDAKSGITLKWKLLGKGIPLGEHAVFLERKEDQKVVASSLTDKNGEVVLAILTGGTYLVRAIEIVAGENGGPDWRSQWTSTSFFVPMPNNEK